MPAISILFQIASDLGPPDAGDFDLIPNRVEEPIARCPRSVSCRSLLRGFGVRDMGVWGGGERSVLLSVSIRHDILSRTGETRSWGSYR